MYSICATRKLLERVAAPIEPIVETPSTTLGNWYATALFWKPQVTLLVNQRTLISVLMPLAPARSLAQRFPSALAELLRCFGVDEAFIASEMAAMSEPALSKTESRSLLGVMNNSTQMLNHIRALDDARDLLELSALLASVPSSAEGREMRFPDLSLFELMDTLGVRHGENPRAAW